MNITVKVKGLEELTKGLDEASRKAVSEMQEAVRVSGELIKQKARGKAGSPPIVFRGGLARSIQNRLGKLKATIGVYGQAENYGYVVEYGRRPGSMPPSAPLERWGRVKLGKSGLGFVLARSIKRKGTKPQPFMQPTFDENRKEVIRRLEMAADRIVKYI